MTTWNRCELTEEEKETRYRPRTGSWTLALDDCWDLGRREGLERRDWTETRRGF